jgi:haloacetate dehalogenase
MEWGVCEDRIDLWDVTLRVRREGAGLPVLLLHGHGGTLEDWDEVVPLLAPRHTVVRCDLRGHGGPARATDEDWPRLEHEMASDSLAIMHSLGHDSFAVVGKGIGGHVAARLAAEHPTKIDRLAVVDVVPLLPPTRPTLVLWSGGPPFAEALIAFLAAQDR